MISYESAEEKEMCELLDRMTSQKEFWHSGVPSEIKFQRFGHQLREADFEQEKRQEKAIYRGFHLRDRNEVTIANSGLSIVKNGKKHFEIKLDVWPFKHDDISVVYVPEKYVSIKGEHREKEEDGSYVSRRFRRHYQLPKGCKTIGETCGYRNWIVTVKATKDGVSDEQGDSVTVPIKRGSFEPLPTAERYKEGELSNVQTVPIRSLDNSASDLDNESRISTEDSKAEESSTSETEQDRDTDLQIEIPITTEDSKTKESSTSEIEQDQKSPKVLSDDSKIPVPGNKDESESGQKGAESSESTPVKKEESTADI